MKNTPAAPADVPMNGIISPNAELIFIKNSPFLIWLVKTNYIHYITPFIYLQEYYSWLTKKALSLSIKFVYFFVKFQLNFTIPCDIMKSIFFLNLILPG